MLDNAQIEMPKLLSLRAAGTPYSAIFSEQIRYLTFSPEKLEIGSPNVNSVNRRMKRYERLEQ